MNRQGFTLLRTLLPVATIITTFSGFLNANQPITYFFAHGLGGCALNKHGYTKLFLPQYPCYAYNGPEIINGFDAKKVVLGQENDIAALEDGLKLMNQETANKPFVGFGVSKGAATWINAAAKLKPANLKALVLESPFADANDEAYDVGKKEYGLEYVPFGREIATYFMKKMYPGYNPDGPQPITSIKHLPIIPIMLIHSEEDKLIHVNHSRRLYRELIKDGRTNVYLVEIANGEHADLLGNFWPKNDDDEELLDYLKPVHAFYKEYNLPYDQELASDATLSNYQPSLEEITEKIESIEQSETLYHCVKLGCAVTLAGVTAYAYNAMSAERSGT